MNELLDKTKRELYEACDDETTGQAKKGAGRMPWHQEPKKDATSCDKPGGTANT